MPGRRITVLCRQGWVQAASLLLLALGIQAATGALLLLVYVPTVEQAHESVTSFARPGSLWWMVRSVHSWGAQVFIGLALVHFFGALFLRFHRPPHEKTWMMGMILLLLALAAGFSGYLLPWTKRSFFAVKVGTEIAGVLPLVGRALKEVIRGGTEVSEATLRRFFAVHVAVLPLLFLLMLRRHANARWARLRARGPGLFSIDRVLRRIREYDRPSEARSLKPYRDPSFPREATLKEERLWLMFGLLLGTLAFLIPPPLGEQADPFAPAPVGIRPEWYLVFSYQALKLIPSRIAGRSGPQVGVVTFLLVGAFFFLFPFIDRRSRRGEPSPWVPWLGALSIAAFLMLTISGLVQVGREPSLHSHEEAPEIAAERVFVNPSEEDIQRALQPGEALALPTRPEEVEDHAVEEPVSPDLVAALPLYIAFMVLLVVLFVLGQLRLRQVRSLDRRMR